MLENFSEQEKLKFKELSPEEKQQRGILGRLYGPIASIMAATRNGRRYTESLWEKVFDNPLTKEMFSQGGIPGELDHPVDREETCSEKIAIMMPEPPTKGPDGKLMGYFDIIDTPCGRVAYALAKYGFNLGISSRGSGDTYTDLDGQEIVDEDTYSFNAFDLVLLPACKDARLQLAESFDINKVNFKRALKESLESSSTEDRKIMTDTLYSLNIDYDDLSDETEAESVTNDNKSVADDNGTELVNALQEALKENNRLQKEIVTLNEKLSVSYTKETRLSEEVINLKDTVRRLSRAVSKSSALSNQLQTMKAQLEEQTKLASERACIIESCKKRLDVTNQNHSVLRENISRRASEVAELNSEITRLTERIEVLKRANEGKVSTLTSELSELKADSQIKNSQYAEKLNRSSKLVEHYKKVASDALGHYIDSKATSLGISAKEIKDRLGESYSLNDVDSICEHLRSYKLNMSKLPFNVRGNEVGRVTLREDTSTQRYTNPDDVVDKDLFDLINN